MLIRGQLLLRLIHRESKALYRSLLFEGRLQEVLLHLPKKVQASLYVTPLGRQQYVQLMVRLHTALGRAFQPMHFVAYVTPDIFQLVQIVAVLPRFLSQTPSNFDKSVGQDCSVHESPSLPGLARKAARLRSSQDQAAQLGKMCMKMSARTEAAFAAARGALSFEKRPLLFAFSSAHWPRCLSLRLVKHSGCVLDLYHSEGQVTVCLKKQDSD